MLRVLYLVHDMLDPAVRRRVLMLQEGGAAVTVAGFRRGSVPAGVAAVQSIDLGRTHDARFGHRLAAAVLAAGRLRRLLRGVAKPDVIVARNLEMLALARRAKGLWRDAGIGIVYESLDIHRLLLRADHLGRLLRGVERWLGRDARLLMTSSPAFVENYFEKFGQIRSPVELVENRLIEFGSDPARMRRANAPAGPPWRIGWFGALRCRRSLELLSRFTRERNGAFEVVLRGRPALTEFEDFHKLVAAEPFIRFAGPYRNPEDVASIYEDIHFSWTVDFFEAGLNSSWLLPNRLYEGCRFGAVPIAMADTETGRFLARRRIGIRLASFDPVALGAALDGMTQARFRAMRRSVVECGDGTWMCGPADCRALVGRLRSVADAGAGITRNAPLAGAAP